MVVVELEAKPEMPGTVLIPKEQVAVMIPMPKNADLKYELYADDDVPTVEQLAKANAQAKAYREQEALKMRQTPSLKELREAEEATKAKLPDETVSSSKSDEGMAKHIATFGKDPNPHKGIGEPAKNTDKPKKRGRRFGSKNKKKG